MTLSAEIITVYSLVRLVAAAWLFSHALPRREPGVPRAIAAVAVLGALIALASALGFSIFPMLTDDASFFIAIATFVIVLAAVTGAIFFVFECSPLTALFCGSMAYSLDAFAGTVERFAAPVLPVSSYPPPLLEGSLRWLGVTAAVFVLVNFTLVRRIEKNGLLSIKDPVLVLTAAAAILVNMVFDLILKDLAMFDVPARYKTGLMMVYLLICVYVMYSSFEIAYNRRLQVNMAALDQLRRAEARQYELSRENIEAINIKCHDIRHQIRTLAGGGAAVDATVLDDISREVDVYDSVVKSGNTALDTILTEKSLFCEKHGITLSCIADGGAVDFMQPADIYSLFGNALDNAIEAVERLGDPERRSISLIVQRHSDMATIHVENFFDGQVRFGTDGLPMTSKGDAYNHGFGSQSMRRIVESYDGMMSVAVQEDIYHVNAMIPID